jgi:drug/metabolite transporter (DMT)-like permease
MLLGISVWIGSWASSWAWAFLTVGASAAQTARNVMQRDLVAVLGTAGATHVRFLFSLPFIAALYVIETQLIGFHAPAMHLTSLLWLLAGAAAQAFATGLMLAGMKVRSFVVITAYTKTEPVIIAIFGAIFLHETPSLAVAAAVVIATAGVMLMSWPRAAAGATKKEWQSAALGLLGGAFFALSATCYRGGLIGLDGENVFIIATTALLAAQTMQCAIILAYLGVFDRPLLKAIARNWRKSLFAGAMGALASQLWLMAFTLTSAAAVRTLALLEVPMAQVVTRRMFRQGTSGREYLGMALIVGGIVLLING